MFGKKEEKKKKDGASVILLIQSLPTRQTQNIKAFTFFFQLETTSFLEAFDLRRRYISVSLLNGLYEVQPE